MRIIIGSISKAKYLTDLREACIILLARKTNVWYFIALKIGHHYIWIKDKESYKNMLWQFLNSFDKSLFYWSELLLTHTEINYKVKAWVAIFTLIRLLHNIYAKSVCEIIISTAKITNPLIHLPLFPAKLINSCLAFNTTRSFALF